MNLTSCSGSVIESAIGSAFVDGSLQTIRVCLEVGFDGLVVEVGGGLYPNEVSWSLTFPSGIVETGGAGSSEVGVCPVPSPQPSMTRMPTTPCESYTAELYDNFGDG